jgi:hypothetical protein
MPTNDDRLLADLSRRNWWILGILVLLSLLWRSRAVTLGVAGGGLVAIGGFYWLHRSLICLLEPAGGRTRRGFQFSSVIRLMVLAAALFLLLVPGRVHPVGLAVGVSVVVINLIWTALARIFKDRTLDG